MTTTDRSGSYEAVRNPCPTCDGTGAAPRCDSVHNQWLCQRTLGHDGPHLAYLEGDAAFRWGMAGRGCFDPSCIRSANHPLPHRDGKGSSWVPDEELADA